MTSNVELLPCPFCGGEAHLERQGHVCCKTMFCRGAGAFDNYGSQAEQNASAVARWNTRANLAELQREIEALRAATKELERARRGAFEAGRKQAARAERLAEALREAADMLLADYPETAKRLRAALHPTAAQENDDA